MVRRGGERSVGGIATAIFAVWPGGCPRPSEAMRTLCVMCVMLLHTNSIVPISNNTKEPKTVLNWYLEPQGRQQFYFGCALFKEKSRYVISEPLKTMHYLLILLHGNHLHMCTNGYGIPFGNWWRSRGFINHRP